jgi:hypothetical protein
LTRPSTFWAAQIQDISAEGARLVLNHPVPAGSFLTIRMPPDSDEEMRMLRARVVRSIRRDESRQWVVGCIINPQLTDAELDWFV